MGNSVKIRLAKINKKQVDLLKEIRKRGFKNLQPPALSTYINGNSTAPQSEAVMKLVYEILSKWEKEQK